jgi:hypothetical protein
LSVSTVVFSGQAQVAIWVPLLAAVGGTSAEVSATKKAPAKIAVLADKFAGRLNPIV